jgi:hypothetical protein
MPGLSLRTGINIGSTGGSYTPMTPAAANSPTSNAGSIAQAAYGISGSGGAANGTVVPAYGSITIGVISLAALVYLWWSLPR